jgi:VCBS repeat-containing protein
MWSIAFCLFGSINRSLNYLRGVACSWGFQALVFLVLSINSMQAATVVSLDVASGTAAGGTTVTITGTGYVDIPTTLVAFGGVLAVVNSVPDAFTIVCTTPPHAVGLVPVQVFISGIAATGSVAFTYNDLDVRISPITIEAGSSSNIIIGDPVGDPMLWNPATMNLVTYASGPIIYAVLFAGDQGVLTLSGVPLEFGDFFTQDDVNNGDVRYTHTGDEGINSDEIVFSVLADGLETFPPPLGIIINNSFNDPPVITPPSTLVTLPGIPVTSNILVSDPDDTVFTFVVTAPPTKGLLSNIESNGGFTYTANLGTSGTDVFTVTVTDQGTPAKSTSQQFTIAITGSDSAAAPVITTLPPMEVVANTTLLYTPILATANPNYQYQLIWISNPSQPDKDTIANRFRDTHAINWPNIPIGDGYQVFVIKVTDPNSGTAATQRIVIKVNATASPAPSLSLFGTSNG